MIFQSIFKNLFFIFHILFILLSSVLIIFYWQILIINIITIISWYFNNNICLLTQIEKYLFDQTLVDVLLEKQSNHYIIPFRKRIPLYITFTIGFIYHFLIYFSL